MCDKRHVVHCDVKLDNLMLFGETVAKLGDFGLAVRVQRDGLTAYRTFKPRYAAPEFRGTGRYGCPVDMWSVGIVLFELLTGTRRYHQRICSVRRVRLPKMAGVDGAAQELFERLVSLDPGARPTADEVLAHPWVVGTSTNSTTIRAGAGSSSVILMRDSGPSSANSVSYHL